MYHLREHKLQGNAGMQVQAVSSGASRSAFVSAEVKASLLPELSATHIFEGRTLA